MGTIRPYHRGLYRLPVTYPVMYCVVSTVGEGTIMNLSALGCTIETNQPLSENRSLALRLLLPDQPESLPIALAQIRWVKGNRAGIEFTQVDRTANLRLHTFVWDKMVGTYPDDSTAAHDSLAPSAQEQSFQFFIDHVASCAKTDNRS